MSNRLHITKLVEDGILTPGQGALLLKQLDLAEDTLEAQPAKRVNFIRVKLADQVTGEVLHEVRVPLTLVRLGLRLSRKVWADVLNRYPDMKQFKVSFWDIYSRIERDVPGKAVDLTSRDGTRRLEIWLE